MVRKNNLEKLLVFIEEIANQPENEWFKVDLFSRLNHISTSESVINEIHEYCIKMIIEQHARMFYKNFKILEIKNNLVCDFIRMEQFRRNDNFQDFCLACFQQCEGVVNYLVKNSDFINFLKDNAKIPAISIWNKEKNSFTPAAGKVTIGSLIFQTKELTTIDSLVKSDPVKWYFNYRLRAVLFFFYFNKQVKYNTEEFERVYDIGNTLYLGRNLNHRSVDLTPKQKNKLDQVLPDQHKYYFRFLGFLEDFLSTINKNLV